MLNALWLNAEALNGRGELTQIIALAGTASASVSVMPAVVVRRIGVATTVSATASAVATVARRRVPLLLPVTVGVAVVADATKTRVVGAHTFVLSEASYFNSHHVSLAGTGTVSVAGILYTFALAQGTADIAVSAEHPNPQRVRSVSGTGAASAAVEPPTANRSGLCYGSVTVTASGIAVPDWTTEGVHYRGLGASALALVVTEAQVDPRRYVASSVIATAFTKFVEPVRVANVGGFGLALAMGQSAQPVRMYRAVATTVRATVSTSSIAHRTGLVRASATANVAGNRPPISLNVFAGGSVVTGVNVVPIGALLATRGIKAHVTTGVAASGITKPAWRGYSVAVVRVLADGMVAVADKVAGSGHAGVSITADPVAIPAIKVAGTGTVTMTASKPGYFITRMLGANAVLTATAIAKATNRRSVGAQVFATVAVIASASANLYAREPDFRTDVVPAGDWSDTVPPDDWQVFIYSDSDPMKTFQKQPSDVLAYDLDFGQWFLLIPNDDIASATCVVTTATQGDVADLSIDRVLLVGDTGDGTPAHIVKVWLSGGTDGTTYKLTLVMQTEDGRTKEYDFKLKVKNL